LKQVLIIKTSSLGDVVHTLPAVSDAAAALSGIRFDWVVEEGIAEIPAWHPAVDRVIPVALRRWRKDWWQSEVREQRAAFHRSLSERRYDAVIDAQGLLKSAWLSLQARGPTHGLSWSSAREPLASLAYRHRHPVSKGTHAIHRVRQLFADSLGYPLPETAPRYGMDRGQLQPNTHANPTTPYVVFLHGTTWATKHWPEPFWIQLAGLATTSGHRVLLPWGSPSEHERAQRIAAAHPTAAITVLPRLPLRDLASILAGATGVIAVDTGLAHVAAALDVPAVTLYGPTEPGLTGTLGSTQTHLRATFPCAPCFRRTCNFTGPHPVEPPCFQSVPPTTVWNALRALTA
jgi:heptosyltransferase-1